MMLVGDLGGNKEYVSSIPTFVFFFFVSPVFIIPLGVPGRILFGFKALNLSSMTFSSQSSFQANS